MTTPTNGHAYTPDYPTRTYYPYPDPSRRTVKWHDDHRWKKKIRCEYPTRARFIRERWIAGAGYLTTAEHRNVSAGTLDSSTDWRSLAYTPRCGSDCLPDNIGAASVIYAIGTDTLGDNDVFLELTWEDAPADPDNCWVALHRPGEGDEAWNWFKPGEEMRVALTPVSQYRHETIDDSVYIAVALTGTTPAVLRKVALREYDADTVDRYSRRDRDCTASLDANASLVLEPHGLPGDPPEAGNNAEALYAFGTYDFEGNEIYIDLDWSTEPARGDCWIGVYRPRSGGEAWNWFRPGDGWRIALSPLEQYQSVTRDETVYIKVVVTGTRPCVLDMVRLREFDFIYMD